jgi:membrane protein DedA with SNARE-associated domain
MFGELILEYKYLVMVPLSLFAQPFVGMTTGFFARLGLMELGVVYAVLVLTALAGDMVWYWVGYHWGERFAKRFGRFVSVTPKHIREVKQFFHTYHDSILLISKVTNGFGLAIVTLFTAGLTRVPFGRYMAINLVGEGVWSAIIVGIGYFFGEAYLRVNDVFGRATLVVAFGLFLLLMIGASKYIRRRLEKKLNS